MSDAHLDEYQRSAEGVGFLLRLEDVATWSDFQSQKKPDPTVPSFHPHPDSRGEKRCA